MGYPHLDSRGPTMDTVQRPPLDTVQEPTQPVLWRGTNNIGTSHQVASQGSQNGSKVHSAITDDESSGSSSDESSTGTPNRPHFGLPSDGVCPMTKSPPVGSSRCSPVENTASSDTRPQPGRNLRPENDHSTILTTETDTPDSCMQQNQKPRGSFDYLNDALTKVGKSTSDLLSRFNLRDWLGTSTPSTPISDYTPWNGRRATTAGLTTPGSNRMPRRGLLQHTFDEDDNSDDDERLHVGWCAGDGEHQSASNPDFWSPRQTQVEIESARPTVPNPRFADLAGYTNYWFMVGESMTNGNACQRSFPATLATLKRAQMHPPVCSSKFTPSPVLPRVPARSSSMEPSVPMGPVPQTSSGRAAVPTALHYAPSRESLIDNLDQQIKAQKRVASMGGAGCGTRRTESGSVIPDALLVFETSPTRFDTNLGLL
ncbi:unnamed protein product [Echinostoma caproni]|uniref:Uncharacterized protein n=1 Tax=Echinostoma caproni TaxID=27848 RepID=A0A183AS56_9TREM|nr:unnamed protein product [Echinostoma caproni]